MQGKAREQTRLATRLLQEAADPTAPRQLTHPPLFKMARNAKVLEWKLKLLKDVVALRELSWLGSKVLS